MKKKLSQVTVPFYLIWRRTRSCFLWPINELFDLKREVVASKRMIIMQTFYRILRQRPVFVIFQFDDMPDGASLSNSSNFLLLSKNEQTILCSVGIC